MSMHVAVCIHTQAYLCESEDTLKTLALSSTVQVPGTGLGSSGSVAGVFAHSTISLAPKECEVSLNRFFFGMLSTLSVTELHPQEPWTTGKK